jgi:FixJ family two-component response regulator
MNRPADPAEEPTVFVVDDDPDMRRSLQWLIESISLVVETFSSAEEFLAAGAPFRPGCLLLDVRMPGMGGLRLLERMRASEAGMPVIMFTGNGEVPMAVKALKNGAFDFIEKPANHQLILERIQDALGADRERRARESERAGFELRMRQLTEREREVMDRSVDGESCRDIAAAVGISERTVEKHREKLMHKLEARSLAHLVRLVVEHRARA